MAPDCSDFVLIGFIEPRDVVGDQINTNYIWRENYIGGEPVFSPNLSEDDFRCHFSVEQVSCTACGQNLAFIAQMCCPVDSKPIDRVVYLFGCVNIDCKDRKWKIFRVVTPQMDDEMMEEHQGGDSDHHENGHDSMELGDGTNHRVPGTPFRLPFSEKVSKFKAFFLTVEEEKDVITNEDGNKDKAKGAKVDSAGNEVYEKFLIPGTDEVANKFLKTVSKFNRQVIRYEWKGKPLLNQDIKIKPGQCSSCGSERTFELQIMPGLISVMKSQVEESTELEYGTVLFFTCKNNCNRDRNVYIEEPIVLNDPDSVAMPTF